MSIFALRVKIDPAELGEDILAFDVSDDALERAALAEARRSNSLIRGKAAHQDEARQIAANIAKLPELVRKD